MTRGASLLSFLDELQESHGGAIPVENYLREALYHPEFGYYSQNIRTVGHRGDFATSATLGSNLGRALARWLAVHRPTSGSWHVIEAGAGSGELAATILKSLPWWTRRSVNYHIVESSPVLRGEQQSRLRRQRVSWHNSMPEALTACSGRASIFSNELVDAFPCRTYERRSECWHEVGVRITGGKIEEVLLADRPVPRTSIFKVPYPDGQRVEVHVAAAEWLHSWTPRHTSGQLLTIDYGDRADTLLHRRPHGTLRAYFHHQQIGGLAVYHRFGRQDITADVNFTDLQAWGEDLGYETERLTDQSGFLTEYGGRSSQITPHDAALANISGAGSAFKVLIQNRRTTPAARPPADWLFLQQAKARSDRDKG
ncbi:MAG: SAM-dependent methyltransferase [Chthoniobacterales bacterium]